MSADNRAHEDPGLQPERTAQAWQRTAFALAVSGAIALRWSAEIGLSATVLGAVVLSVAAAAVLLALQHRHYRRATKAIQRGSTASAPWSVMLLSAAVCALAIVGLVGSC